MTNAEHSAQFAADTASTLNEMGQSASAENDTDRVIDNVFVGNYRFNISALDGSIVVNTPSTFGGQIMTDDPNEAANFINDWVN